MLNILIAVSALSFGSDLRVPQDFRRIQFAIDAAQDGDRVLVSPGTYKGNGNTNLRFWGKKIALIGVGGRSQCFIELAGMTRGLTFDSGETSAAMVRGFTFRGGSSAMGGAIYVAGASPIIANCAFEHNWAQSGGAVAISGGNPEIRLCEFTNNHSQFGGAISIAGGSAVKLSGTTVQSNTSSGDGGGIGVSDGSLEISRSFLLTNKADGNGGGVAVNRGSLTVSDSYLQESIAGGAGGGVRVGQNATAQLNQVSVLLNQATTGPGGVSAVVAGTTIRNSIVAFNRKDQASANVKATSSYIPGLRMDATEKEPVFQDLGSFDARSGYLSTALFKTTPAGTTNSTDIEGNGRPSNDKGDLGAYQHLRGRIDWPREITITVPHDGSPSTDVAHLNLDANAYGEDGAVQKGEWYLDGALMGNVTRLSTDLRAGDYDLVFQSTDSIGVKSQRLTKVHVLPEPNETPYVELTVENMLTTGNVTVATISVFASDADGDPISPVWQDGNGGVKRTFVLVNGNNNFTVTVTDPYGAQFTAAKNIRFDQPAGPAITLNGSRIMGIEAGGSFSDPGATARDLTTGVPLPVTVTGSVNPFHIGDYDLIYGATSNGMSASVTRTVKVRDSIAPVLTMNGSASMKILMGTSYVEPGVFAYDSFEGAVPVTVSGAVNTSTPGYYALTYRAADSSGNASTAVRTVRVVATFNPTITVLGSNPIQIEVGSLYTDAGATAVDYNGLSLVVAKTGTVDNLTLGDYTITYRATDSESHTSSATRLVKVRDTTKPVITLKGSNPTTVEVGGTYAEAGATATDNYDGAVAVSVSGTVTSGTVGTYTRTYTATDSSGNVATLTRTVNVVATIPPTITINGVNPATVTVLTSYSDAGASAKDELGATVAVTTTGSVDVNTVGSYSITYKATDRWGQTTTRTRAVNVVPQTIPPTVTVTGSNPATVYTGLTYTDAGATAADVFGTALTVTKTGSVNTSVKGNYTITYSATDKWGNVGTATRTVTVKDNTTPPTITLIGANPQYFQWKDKYVELGATAVDVTGTSLTVTIDSSSVTTNKPATYYVTYTATDRWGATATVTRTVIVIPPLTPPVLTLNGSNPMYVLQNSTYTEPGATATDYFGNSLPVSITGSVNTSNLKTFTITYTAKDDYGNSTTVSRAVTIVKAPSITLNGGNPVSMYRLLTYTESGATATAGDGSSLAVSITGTVNTSTAGTYVLTYSATDAYGFSVSTTRTVNVLNQTTPPTITLKGSNPMTIAARSSFTDPGATAADIIGTSLTVTTSGNVNVNKKGTYTLTYSATDRWGNTATATRTVTVQ